MPVIPIYDEAEQALSSFPVLLLTDKEQAEILEITKQLRFEQARFLGASTFLPHNPWHLTETRDINNPW